MSWTANSWRLDDKGYCVLGKFRDGTSIHAHRITVEKMLGRPLKSEEQIHHRDGRRWNNCPFNLQVTTRSKHMAMHRHNGWSDDEMIEALYDLATRLGRRPTARHADTACLELGSPSASAYIMRFGTWNRALTLALGVRLRPHQKS